MKAKPQKKNIFLDRKTLLKQKDSNISNKKEGKTKKSLSKRELEFRNKIKSQIFLWSGILILIISIIGSGFVWIKTKEFQEKIDSKIIPFQKSTSCKKYEKSLISAFINIDLDKNKEIKGIYLNIFNNSNKFSLKIDNYPLIIDNADTKGTIIDYIRLNNLFLNQTTLFENLSKTLIRQLYIKIDYIIIGENISFKTFPSLQNDLYKYLFNQLAETSFDYQIVTDLCIDSLNSLAKDFYNIEDQPLEQDYQANPLNKFDFSNIRKEQIRIYLNNRSGVIGFGEFYKELMQGYGLNIVKLDNSVGVTSKTSIAIDDTNLQNTDALKMIKYLLNNQTDEVEVNTKSNIFSDIYIELGEDSLLSQ